MEETQAANQVARDALQEWQIALEKNSYTQDPDFQHSVQYHLGKDYSAINQELTQYGEIVPKELDQLVKHNNLDQHLPQLNTYTGIGERCNDVIHDLSYVIAGNIIYSSDLMAKMATPGGLFQALCFLFLSAQTGEAGHHCPIACSAGIIRVLNKYKDIPHREFYLEKLTTPSYDDNFTGAQFLTEIQGGSDVGQNATLAEKFSDDTWRIRGEKWFCSNAHAELILITARVDPTISGTKGLGLFLIPKYLEDNTHNHFTLRRLKNKIGTRSMASAEIDFQGAVAYPVGKVENGIKIVLEEVLHLSRIFNSFCMLGMGRRAYFIARSYAQFRVAFGNPIFNYPLVQENLAQIKAENEALLAAICRTTQLQDNVDLEISSGTQSKLLIRTLVNLNKYISALWTVNHIHHAIDVLAGNGAIETFSILPRLLRDSIVCENWEGTHNTLRLQILRDIHKYEVDSLLITFLQDELARIDGYLEFVEPLEKALEKLALNLETLKSHDDEIQSLMIKSIVDEMAILMCACSLLLSAIDQCEHHHSSSKLNCLRYFIELRINKSNIKLDSAHLQLLRAINNF